MDSTNFRREIQRQFNKIKSHELFRVQIDSDLLWDTYLKSFPEGTNPIYKECKIHECNTCKQFIRSVGNMVALIDGEMHSIWDINITDQYKEIAEALSKLVKSCPIENKFLHIEPFAGKDKNYKLLDSGETITFEHFYIQLPNNLVVNEYCLASQLADFRTTKEVMVRSII